MRALCNKEKSSRDAARKLVLILKLQALSTRLL